MAARISKYYLFCQIGGWGLILVLITGLKSWMMGKVAITTITGLVVSHLLRNAIIRYGWLQLPVRNELQRLFAGTVLACMLAALVRGVGFFWLTGRELTVSRYLVSVMDYAFLLFPWAGTYLFYHYIVTTDRQKAKNRRLTLRVQELEKQAEESGVDAEVIFESLKRIQELIDEEPGRARGAITEFGKVLRKGSILD
jgi:hypothetical protein